MTSKNQDTNKKWGATHLRITVFPTAEFKGSPEKLWPEKPEVSLEETKSKSKNLETILEGSFNDQKVIVAVLPIKIDLVIKAPDEIKLDTPPEPTILTLGDFQEKLASFNEIAQLWLNQIDIGSIKRIAFGAELVKNVSGIDEGYKDLSRLLPFSIDAKDTSNFTLQINKPTIYKLGEKREVSINRLTNWGVIKRRLQVGMVADLETSFNFDDAYFSLLTLDINNAPNQGEFNKAESLELYNSLVEFGKSISEKGFK